jgi:hypothetical protein
LRAELGAAGKTEVVSAIAAVVTGLGTIASLLVAGYAQHEDKPLEHQVIFFLGALVLGFLFQQHSDEPWVALIGGISIIAILALFLRPAISTDDRSGT